MRDTQGHNLGTYQLADSRQIQPIRIPQLRICFGVGERLFNERNKERPNVLYVDVCPAAQALADLNAPPSLDHRLRQVRNLDASLVDGTLTLAVDDAGENESRVYLRAACGDIEHIVVDCAGGVSLDDGDDVRHAVEVIENSVAG